MYAYIKGQLVKGFTSKVVLEANGIGYVLHVPINVLSKLPQEGSQVLLHTSFVVRELSQTLYGFLNESERDFFETLMDVTGVGPKLALSIIGHMPLPELSRAIRSADLAGLSKIPGIGKKTAERLVIELRDKLPESVSASDFAVKVSDVHAQKIQDAMRALVNLGYTQITAQKALKKTLSDIQEDADLPTLIMHSLKHV